MASYGYKIGITQAALTNVEDITGVAPHSVFMPHVAQVKMASGDILADGYISFIWTFDYLTREAFEALVTQIVGSANWQYGASKHVYVETRDLFGDYHRFYAVCNLPFELEPIFRGFNGVELKFTQAELIS